MLHASQRLWMSYARVHELQLPTIEELIGLEADERDERDDDWTLDTRVQTTGSVRRIPTPSTIVRAAVRLRAEVVDFAHLPSANLRLAPASERALPSVLPSVQPAVPSALPLADARRAPTLVSIRTRAQRAIVWPVFFCGLLAGVFGGIAFFESPLGKKPAVQHVVKQLQGAARTVVR